MVYKLGVDELPGPAMVPLTQDVSKCEKILEMKKIDFSRSLSISKSTNLSYGPSDRSGTISNFSHFLLPMDGTVRDADILS